MNILEIAIQAEGNMPSAVARKLDVTPQVVSNWRRRGTVPHFASRELKRTYAKQISAAINAEKLAELADEAKEHRA